MNPVIECKKDFCVYAGSRFCPYNSHRVRGYLCPMWRQPKENREVKKNDK